MNKRGLSGVVITLILILVSIVAIGIIWVVISNFVSEGSKGISLGRFLIKLDIESAYRSGDEIFVTISRGSDDLELTKIQFIISNDTTSESIEKEINLQKSSKNTFTISETEFGVEADLMDEISIAPIYIEEGETQEKLGDIIDTETIGTGGAGSGEEDGEEGEENGGDDGNGDDYNETIGEGNNCTSDENCSVGLKCEGGVCLVPCNGVWEGDYYNVGIYECDGENINGCNLNTCLCENGFTPSGSGVCNLNDPLNTGNVNDVFPEGNPFMIYSSDLPYWGDENLQNKYINFSGEGLENDCLQISLHYQVGGTNYLRLTESNVDITTGINYFVWEAENCGQ